MDGEPLQYGIPLKPGAKHGHGETGIDDAWLVLSTFIRDDGAVPEFPHLVACLLYTSPSPRDRTRSRMPSSA